MIVLDSDAIIDGRRFEEYVGDSIATTTNIQQTIIEHIIIRDRVLHFVIYSYLVSDKLNFLVSLAWLM